MASDIVILNKYKWRITTGVKNRNNIENILESMKLLDSLYVSTEKRKEFEL